MPDNPLLRPMDSQYQKELQVALDAARRASKVVMRYFCADELCVQMKDDQSPVTAADLESNEVICSLLGASFDYEIVSEEESLSRGSTAGSREASFCEPTETRFIASQKSHYPLPSIHYPYWIIDPLDGTKEFVDGIDEFVINIALVRGDRPVVGVVAVPAQNKYYYAVAGQGAFVICGDDAPRQIHCFDHKDFATCRVAVSRSHCHPDIKAFLAKYPKIKLMPLGSALKYCYIAEGKVDATIRKTPLKEWDICAPDCVVTEAGGKVTDLAGNQLRYGGGDGILLGGLVAGNEVIHYEHQNYF